MFTFAEARNTPAPRPFWIVLGAIAAAVFVIDAAVWYAMRGRISDYRARRLRISMYGLIAWAVFCFARAATL
jgi:hypothetical protein